MTALPSKRGAVSIVEKVDSVLKIAERRGVCYTCGLAYNGVKVHAKCPKCGRVIKTEQKCEGTIVTGTWIRITDFRSHSSLA